MLNVGAFEAHNQRHLQTDLFHSSDHALGDHVTAHDATKDVHQNALHVGVRGDDLEGFGHFLFGGAAANVEEVCRFRTIQFDDVHRRHGQTRTVHHTADFAVQCDVVQVELGRGQFFGVFFGFVAQGSNISVAIDRVAIKAQFRVQQFQAAGVGHDQRVDLQHLHVFFHEGFVEDTHQGNAFFDLFALKAQSKCNAATVERLIAGGGINREAQDFFGRAGSDFFDVHAAFGRADERHAAGDAVNQQGEIQFAFDVRTVFDVDAVHLLASRTGLMRDQSATQHFLGFFSGLFDRLGEAYTAFFASIRLFERAFTAPTCVDLRFDDPQRAVQFACCGFSFVSFENDTAFRDRGAIGTKESLRLIFMNVHEESPVLVQFRLCHDMADTRLKTVSAISILKSTRIRVL